VKFQKALKVLDFLTPMSSHFFKIPSPKMLEVVFYQCECERKWTEEVQRCFKSSFFDPAAWISRSPVHQPNLPLRHYRAGHGRVDHRWSIRIPPQVSRASV